MKKILVIGSLNMDTVIETPSMPEVGETISGRNITHIPGGKGANQAYSIGKLGGDIAMLGAVGDDSKGQKLIENLKSAGVDVSRVQVLRNTPTGQAFITVDDKGENSIIIIAGANGKVTKKLIDNNMDLLTRSDIVIMQLEIPLEIVEYIKDLVKNEKKIIISCVNENDKVRLSVFNTGDLIPKDELDKIWIKFYKVDKARTREYGGSGIGLSIVKAIMELHNQRCGVIIHEDGVEFWIELDTNNSNIKTESGQ